ncbi:hypothetical protein AURDEDRAFT_53520 [Auricularia subglabra TFB-10046 SS5]|nr:hypothetical protein AURDEDRAFT_53520 [Auricularia subglabra TFB-10046 SS5]
MESDLRCNRLTCRTGLVDKAVVTTCSHIFCIDCANELFTAAQAGLTQLCCNSTSLTSHRSIASLHPTNDYKTSVLSGLAPSIILEICSRAIAFWSYQIHQEQAFQQAVLKNATEKSNQMQKQLDNVIREANTELSLLNTKVTNVERELEMERRKVRELQESSREKDKEYAKLKASLRSLVISGSISQTSLQNQYDKVKRKALMNPSALSGGGHAEPVPVNPAPTYAQHQQAQNMGFMNTSVSTTNTVSNIASQISFSYLRCTQRPPAITRPTRTLARATPG